MKIEKANWTISAFEDALKEIMEFWSTDKSLTLDRRRLKLVFSEEVIVGLIGKTKKGKEFTLAFYKGQSSSFIYSNRINARRGYYVSHLPLNKLVSVETIDNAVDWQKASSSLRHKFHRNAWTDIQAKLDDDGTYLRDDRYGVKDTLCITQKFPKYVIQELMDAFDFKKDYSFRIPGTKRDLSVQTKLCDDGIFRAWYSSEYAGCGNGDYYILINPTTAAFHERD